MMTMQGFHRQVVSARSASSPYVAGLFQLTQVGLAQMAILNLGWYVWG